MYPLSFVGAGNLAWHLATTLFQSGYPIKEVFSKNSENAILLASQLGEAKPKTDLDFSNSEAKVFFLAVKDDALTSVLSELRLPENAILAHTSGAQSLHIIMQKTIYPAVFYPLQTFSKVKQVNFIEIPICIEATTEQTYQILEEIAHKISTQVKRLDSEQRQILHLSAVFSCNFSNFLFTISSQLLKKQDLSFSLLQPLVNETIEKAFGISPEKAQTGPAVRGDNSIIQKHLELLEGLETPREWQEIYRQMSASVSSFHTPKNH